MKGEKIGWIGLGNIGLPMARRLVGQGFDVTVCGHVRRGPVEEMKRAGAKEVGSPRELAEVCEVIFSMVRDVPQTEEVLFGGNGLWEGLRRGQVLILSSTLSPDFCRRIAERAEQEKGIPVLDAPVSGGPWGAEAGTLTFFVGGDEAVYRRCRPILEAMGRNIFYLGRNGTGQVAKLANNLMLWANTLAAKEAAALAERAGLDRETLFETIKVSTGDSWAVRNWEALMDLLATTETPVLELIYKDMELALEFARHSGLRLPLAGLISQLEPPVKPE